MISHLDKNPGLLPVLIFSRIFLDYFPDLSSTDSRMDLPAPFWILTPFIHLGSHPPRTLWIGTQFDLHPWSLLIWLPLGCHDDIHQVSQIRHPQLERILFLPAPRCVPLPTSYLLNGTAIFLTALARHLKAILASFLPHILSIWSYL